jgi:hypothetical protein
MGDRVWLETATPPVLGKEIKFKSVFLRRHSSLLSGMAMERRW